MRSRSWVAAIGAVAIGAAAAGVAPAAGAEPAAATAPEGRAAGHVELLAGPSLALPTVVAEDSFARAQRASATFNVSYSGFTPSARAAFQRAVQVWASRVSSPVPITVQARFEPLGPGILGSAGPNFVWRNFSGAPQNNTWYVDALANKLAGTQLNGAPDIVTSFNSSFSNWHFGTGSAPAGKYDFTTVVTHELGHGLGFLGAGTVANGKGSVRLSGTPKHPTIYDRFTENSAGKATLSFPDNSTALKNVLVGGQLYFDSPKVRSANNNSRARLYAPNPFQQGSSYSHLNEATYPAGNANSLMTPQLGAGETIRNPGGITMAILDTLGW